MAAEIARPGAQAPPAAWSFNEAAANGRGNPWRTRGAASGPGCFNEAAANGRGNHAVLSFSRRRPKLQ